MRARLEEVGATFLRGYHAALEEDVPDKLAPELNKVSAELRGFAFEGAAMGLELLDTLTPWRPARVAGLLRVADAHTYMIHVGAGWLWARLPSVSARSRKRLDPLLSWLAYDGWGFHEGFFHWPDYVAGRAHPRRLTGYEKRVFDQGLGRSFWFVNGGNPAWVGRTIFQFAKERQADLWSGIGLAATYAGLADETTLAALNESSGPHRAHLAQGAAFAAKARERAGNLTSYTELATRALCGLPALEAARLCDTALENLPGNGPEPAYEVWRRRVQQHFESAQTLQEA